MWLNELVATAAANLPEVEEDLWARGMSPDQGMSLQVGYLPSLPDGEYPDNFVRWFSNREDVYVFPLTTFRNTITGIQVRYRDRDKKGYSDFYVSKTEPSFFGLGLAAPHIFRTRSAIVVEGVFDFFPVHRFAPQTFATLTAATDSNLSRSLRRVVDNVTCFYDRDFPGKKGFFDLRESMQGIEVYRWEYPPTFTGKDPGEMWEQFGEDWFQEHMKGQLK